MLTYVDLGKFLIISSSGFHFISTVQRPFKAPATNGLSLVFDVSPNSAFTLSLSAVSGDVGDHGVPQISVPIAF